MSASSDSERLPWVPQAALLSEGEDNVNFCQIVKPGHMMNMPQLRTPLIESASTHDNLDMPRGTGRKSKAAEPRHDELLAAEMNMIAEQEDSERRQRLRKQQRDSNETAQRRPAVFIAPTFKSR